MNVANWPAWVIPYPPAEPVDHRRIRGYLVLWEPPASLRGTYLTGLAVGEDRQHLEQLDNVRPIHIYGNAAGATKALNRWQQRPFAGRFLLGLVVHPDPFEEVLQCNPTPK